MHTHRKKHIAKLFLLTLEIGFLVLTLRVVAKPLRPDRLPGATHLAQVGSGLTRGLSLQAAEGQPRLLAEHATPRPARLEPIASIIPLKPASERQLGCDNIVPLLQLLSRFKIPLSGSDDPSLIG
jgi:hypothetical protein